MNSQHHPGIPTVMSLVMSIGADAELLEPTDLREEIRDEIKAMGKAYKTKIAPSYLNS